jgi:hypothetical protein
MSQILKIISVFAILFGTLGIQTRTVEEVSVKNVPLEVAVTRTELTVVSSKPISEVVVVSSNQSCSSPDLALVRLDLLLWGSCDFDLKMTHLTTPKLVVTDDPSPNTILSVAHPVKEKFEKHSEISPSYFIEHLVYQNGLVNESMRYQFSRLKQANQVAFRPDIIKQSMDNSQDSIVLLC